MTFDILKTARTAGFLAASLLTLAAGTALAISPEELEAKANEEGVLLLYTSNLDVIMKVIAPAFEAAHPGVRVSWIRLPSTTVFNRYVAESEAGVVQADLLWTASQQLYQERPEMFMELSADLVPNLAVPTAIEAPNDHYVVVASTPHNLTYSTAAVSPADLEAHLASWEDLTDPHWAGRVAMVDPRGSASVSSFLLRMRDTYGAEWLAALGKQVELVDRGSTGAQQVAAGAFDIVFPTDPSHSGDLREQGAPVALWSPSGPAHQLEHSMAIPNESTHPAAAQLFMQWVLSPEGQTVLCDVNMVPLREAGDACPVLSPERVSPTDSVADEIQNEMIRQLGLEP